MSTELIAEYMADCRALVLDELQRIVPSEARFRAVLYDLMLTYPLREAKSLRPALCIATCRAFGGSTESVTTSATVLELYHNAFLVHDDIEDGSELRRDGPTLHRQYGVPVALNVGDAMLALALEPLLDNMRRLSLGKALRILQTVARMARESAEGQALELSWIRSSSWSITDRDYLRMVHKKTSHYTFLAPMVVGAITGDATGEQLTRLRLFATALGIAFQIQDDLLNLTGATDVIGKEIDGDLWEGKYTLILIHALRTCAAADRRRALAILKKSRPNERGDDDALAELESLAGGLEDSGELSGKGRAAIRRWVAARRKNTATKTSDDVRFLKRLIRKSGSIEHAAGVACIWAARAERSLEAMEWLEASVHKDFLRGVTEFVVTRDH